VLANLLRISPVKLMAFSNLISDIAFLVSSYWYSAEPLLALGFSPQFKFDKTRNEIERGRNRPERKQFFMVSLLCEKRLK